MIKWQKNNAVPDVAVAPPSPIIHTTPDNGRRVGKTVKLKLSNPILKTIGLSSGGFISRIGGMFPEKLGGGGGD